MIALVVHSDPHQSARLSAHLMKIGFNVMTVESLVVADAMSRNMSIDLMIVEETIQGALSHRILLTAERRNPGMSAVLMTDKTGADADELFLLLPAVHALLAPNAPLNILNALVRSEMTHMAGRFRREKTTMAPPHVGAASTADHFLEGLPVSSVTPKESAPITTPAGVFQSVRREVVH